MNAVTNQDNGAPATINPGAVYTTPEAAALLRVKPVTITRAKRLGKIRAAGRPLRILGSDLTRAKMVFRAYLDARALGDDDEAAELFALWLRLLEREREP